jgi:hypothetical protein
VAKGATQSDKAKAEDEQHHGKEKRQGKSQKLIKKDKRK